MTKLALIRVRGVRTLRPRIAKTLELLRLNKPNHCVVIEDTKQMKGMLNLVKDYITFGTVDEDTLLLLLKKRGTRGTKALKDVASEEEIKSTVKEMMGGKKADGFMNPVFRLRPPRKGFRNTKLPCPKGDLGVREDINSLLRRMM